MSCCPIGTPQKYCQENYLSCTHNDPAQRGDYGVVPTYLEPGPDYYAPTGHYQSGGRAHGGPDHVNWCERERERERTRERERETETDRERQIEREGERETERDREQVLYMLHVRLSQESNLMTCCTMTLISFTFSLCHARALSCPSRSFFQVPRHPRSLQGPLPVETVRVCRYSSGEPRRFVGLETVAGNHEGSWVLSHMVAIPVKV